MCGIVGALAFGKLSKRDEKIRQKLMRIITTELLLLTEKRGEDATGAAILFDDGNYVGIKRGEKASGFLGKFGNSKERYGSLIKSWKEYNEPARAYIGHCRKGTAGDKEDNENNHPIKIRNIVGVHNGVIRNHEEIFKRLGCKRDGKVDSEAIFRLMHHMTNEGKEPFTMDLLEDMISRLTGAYAVLSFNADNPYQMPIFRDGRPFELVLIKDLSLMFIMSEIVFWNITHFRYERMIGYHDVKMPSLLDMAIEKKMMPDDSAGLFDLTIRCTQETKIDDLWEWKKVPRNNKIWTTQAALNTSNRTGHHTYTGGQKMKEDDKKDEKSTENKATTPTTQNNKTHTSSVKEGDANGTTMRVFNRITKKYELKTVENPEKLAEDKSKTVVVTENTEKTSTTDTAKKEDEKKAQASFREDGAAEDGAGQKAGKLDDRTNYDKKSDEVQDKNVSASKDSESEEYDGPITEVDMKTEDPELIELAEHTYKRIPAENRGYSEMDPLLNDIEVKDEKVANNLGIKVIANRVAKLWWKRGFIAGIKMMRSKTESPKRTDADKDDDKGDKREQHIYNLKSIVVLLAAFFNRVNAKTDGKAKRQLADIAMRHSSARRNIDMESMEKLFNSHERETMRIANGTIGDAVKYTQTVDEEKKDDKESDEDKK